MIDLGDLVGRIKRVNRLARCFMQFDALQTLVLLHGRLEEVALLDESERVDVVEQSLEETVQISLTIGLQRLIQNTLAVSILHNYQLVEATDLHEFIVVNLPGRL